MKRKFDFFFINSKIILAGFFCLSFANSYTQTGTLSGVVKDQTDQNALEFATLALFQSSDSTLVSGSVTNPEGHFLLEKIPFGTYYLRVSYIGYTTHYISNLTLSQEAPFLEIAETMLNRLSDLKSVDIVADQVVFETKIDKKVFNADQNLTSKGGTGLDLLRQIPTITVDADDQILLRGDANVTVLIDGRPSAMPANQLLSQLPASAIEKVEIITNPSAKYDPEGMSGIINVILKKNKLSGFNGTVSAAFDYGKFAHTNNSIALNYRTDKLNLFANYSYRYSKTWFGGSQDRDVLLADSTWDRLRNSDYGERINTYQNARFGLDYFINDKNTLYFTGNAGFGTNLGNRLVNYQNVDAFNETLYASQRNGAIDAPSSNYVFTGGWQKTFKNPEHTLFVDLNYSNLNFLGDEKLWQKYYDVESVNYTTNYQNTLDKTYNQTFLAKADYVWPINDSTIFEAGFHFTQRMADNEFYSESASSDSIYYVNDSLNNRFSFTQNTFAPYITISRQWRKLSAKAGLRAEPTLIKSALITTSESFDQRYYQFFPSAYLSYKLKENAELLVSYSRRINRPDLDQLNPFTNYSDALTLETGNPFLKPEIIHVNEITYTKYWKKFNVNATAYYRLITDLIRRELRYDGIYTHITNSNLGKSNLSGGDLILTYIPIKGLRIISSTSFWNTATKDLSVTDGTFQNFSGMYSSLSASYRNKSGWSFQAWGSYAPVTDVIQGIILPNYGAGFAIQKMVLKNKGSVTLNANDVFKTRWFAFESYDLGNYQMTSIRRWESRRVSISFTYNFGKLTEGKQRRQNQSGGLEDDLDVPVSQ